MAAKSRHILSFAKMLWALSFSTIPLGFLTIFSLMACYFVKEMTSMAIFYLENLHRELESEGDVLSLKPFMFFSVLDCCGITLLYWLRPAHDSVVMGLVEETLVRRCLHMDFERFCSIGPAKNAARIYRSASSIRDGTSILIFDLLGNAIVIASSLKALQSMLESSTFAWFSAALCVLAALQVLLFMSLSSLKKRCITINDSRAEEMSGFYENFVLAKVTNTSEHRRMDPLFRSGAFLTYQVLLDSIKLQSSLYFVAINVFVLYSSTRVRNSVPKYLKELGFLVVALNSIITKGLELESKRIEVEDMDEACSVSSAVQGVCTSTIVPSTIGSLELSGISVFLHGTPILQNVSLRIVKGDKIALVGRNGSGKSTFFRFLLGFLKYSGRVDANHETIDVGSGTLRKCISYLSQTSFSEGTVLEVLREVISSDNEAVAVCKKFGAHDFILGLARGYQTPMGELSHAQQQMINVIRVYSTKSSILLADEPVDCLDPSDRDSIMDILLDSDRHPIKIVILHSKEYIRKFDRVFVAGEHTIRSYTLSAYMEVVHSNE